eukprot:TRINITY_DN2471_c0_g1_i11.p1 TRINITY_DN2471_c0_g1~~TRINITY_DN2471_c0_g1_i11.p1  ORF type:complete len:371 (+),score=124.52 TRINITY_DN2471_c0_g1_i11:117-1229(+)
MCIRDRDVDAQLRAVRADLELAAGGWRSQYEAHHTHMKESLSNHERKMAHLASAVPPSPLVPALGSPGGGEGRVLSLGWAARLDQAMDEMGHELRVLKESNLTKLDRNTLSPALLSIPELSVPRHEFDALSIKFNNLSGIGDALKLLQEEVSDLNAARTYTAPSVAYVTPEQLAAAVGEAQGVFKGAVHELKLELAAGLGKHAEAAQTHEHAVETDAQLLQIKTQVNALSQAMAQSGQLTGKMQLLEESTRLDQLQLRKDLDRLTPQLAQVADAVEQRAEVQDVNLAMQKFSEVVDRRVEAVEEAQHKLSTQQAAVEAEASLKGRWIWKEGAVSSTTCLVPWSHQVCSTLQTLRTESYLCTLIWYYYLTV